MSQVQESRTFVHSMVHRGKMHHATDASAAIADGASLGLYIANGGSATFHAVFSIETGGNARFRLYEDPTVSASTLVTAACVMHRSYRDSASLGASFGHTPTFAVASASILLDGLIGGGTGGNRAGGNVRRNTEWVFAEDTGYIIAACNLSGGATVMAVIVEGYPFP